MTKIEDNPGQWYQDAVDNKIQNMITVHRIVVYCKWGLTIIGVIALVVIAIKL